MIDGDGTGDDRRLNVLLKSYIKWCTTQDTPENNQASHDRILAQLAQCEFAMTKSDYASEMMKEEFKNYERISQTIENSIVLAKKQIEQSKENLILAKKIRKNRMEYDVLAKVINQQPDRKKTVDQLEKLKKELNTLEDKRRSLQRKLEIRRKDFTVLMRSIHELQGKLNDDTDIETDPMSSDEDELNSPEIMNLSMPGSPNLCLTVSKNDKKID